GAGIGFGDQARGGVHVREELDNVRTRGGRGSVDDVDAFVVGVELVVGDDSGGLGGFVLDVVEGSQFAVDPHNAAMGQPTRLGEAGRWRHPRAADGALVGAAAGPLSSAAGLWRL